METPSAEETVAVEKQSALVGSAGKGPWSNNSLHGTFVGTATGTVPASFRGGNPGSSLPITTWFQYTFDGKGHIDPAFGEATIGGKPSGLIKANCTYSLNPETGMGMETITLPGGRTLNRRFSLSNDNTRLHWVSVDPGFQFQGTMQKQYKERDMRTEETKVMTQMRTQDAASASPMKGKTVLFTGASRGMGRYASIELARRGAEILVVGHNEPRGAAAVEAIRGTGGSAAFLRADMGDAEDVCALAEAVLARGGSIDVLIHSAGGMPPSAARTREGVDRGFAQNFLGAFLLTRLLEERLLASAPARVIAVGSAAHQLLKQVDIDAFMHPGTSPLNRYQMGNYQMRSYQTAKLAVTTWIYGLARSFAGRGVTANVLDPGMVKGEFGEQFEGPAPIRLLMNRVIPFFAAVGTQRGSEQYVRLAADPTLVQVSGRYFVSGKEKPEGSSQLSLDPSVQQCINDAAEAWAAPFLRR